MALYVNRAECRGGDRSLAAVLADRTRVLGPYHAATFATRDVLGTAYLVTKEFAGNSVLRAARRTTPESTWAPMTSARLRRDSISALP